MAAHIAHFAENQATPKIWQAMGGHVSQRSP